MLVKRLIGGYFRAQGLLLAMLSFLVHSLNLRAPSWLCWSAWFRCVGHLSQQLLQSLQRLCAIFFLAARCLGFDNHYAIF